jgi:RNA polymerase sigma-70 factor (ECF subfamily)
VAPYPYHVTFFSGGKMATERTDTELVKGVANREESCFEELLNRYGSKVLNLALRITRNQEDAEEILQDVFITVFTKVGSFEHKSQFSSWLYRVTMNSSFMKIRARNRRRAVYLEDIDSTTRQNWVGNRTEMFDVDFMSSRHELRHAIETAIQDLPEEYRAIFILRDIDGLSNEAVSRVLQLSVPAVKSRLHRSRLLMRQTLKKHHDAATNVEEGADIEPKHIV